MIYEENKKRKFPYRYSQPINFNREFKNFLNRLTEYVPRKNFRYNIDRKSVDIRTVLHLYFRNSDDAFLFKLVYADDSYLNQPIHRTVDAAAFYCPYIPLMVTSVAATSLNIPLALNFQTRYNIGKIK